MWSNRTWETVFNSLCIEFKSDDKTELSNYDYLGFTMKYIQKIGKK